MITSRIRPPHTHTHTQPRKPMGTFRTPLRHNLAHLRGNLLETVCNIWAEPISNTILQCATCLFAVHSVASSAQVCSSVPHLQTLCGYRFASDAGTRQSQGPNEGDCQGTGSAAATAEEPTTRRLFESESGQFVGKLLQFNPPTSMMVGRVQGDHTL